MHETQRNEYEKNETVEVNILIVNGKFFVPVPDNVSDFKTMFLELVALGAGQKIHNDIIPPQPWTPETLTIALSELGDVDPDIRTVQLWFQQNTRGISSANMAALARVFGCDDPELTRLWRTTLARSKQNLADRRKKVKTEKTPARLPTEPRPHAVHTEEKLPWFHTACLKPFSETNPLTIPSMLWTLMTGLAILAFMFGVADVAYKVQDYSKQVGYIWAPSWTIGPIIILPLLTMTVTRLLRWWTTNMRPSLSPPTTSSWSAITRQFSPIYWSIAVVSFAFIFLLQWYGIHYRSITNATTSGYMIDWTVMSTVRPDVISAPNQLTLSFYGYLVYGLLIYLLLTGITISMMIAFDYSSIVSNLQATEPKHKPLREAKQRILYASYQTAMLAYLFTLCIKLQSTYLISGGSNIWHWLLSDAKSFLNIPGAINIPLNYSSIPQVTVPILLVIINTLFALTVLKTRRHSNRSGLMVAHILVASLATQTVGTVEGFSLITAIAVGITTIVLLATIKTESGR